MSKCVQKTSKSVQKHPKTSIVSKSILMCRNPINSVRIHPTATKICKSQSKFVKKTSKSYKSMEIRLNQSKPAKNNPNSTNPHQIYSNPSKSIQTNFCLRYVIISMRSRSQALSGNNPNSMQWDAWIWSFTSTTQTCHSKLWNKAVSNRIAFNLGSRK